MNKNERLKLLEQLLVEKESLTLEEICDCFKVHPNTARADVKELVNRGIAEKYYGGVRSMKTAVPSTFTERRTTNIDAKELIGQKASAYLEDGDIIFVDAGTTVTQLFGEGRTFPEHLTVITNNISAMIWLMQNTNYTVYVLPGRVDRQLNSLASIETIDSLVHYNIRKAFIGCRKIAPNGTLTSASLTDARVKEMAIRQSEEFYLMADAGKVGSPELYSFANLKNAKVWICDKITTDVSEIVHNTGVHLD